MVADNTISGKIAKDLLDIVWSEGGDPRVIVESRGLRQVTDTRRDREGDRCGDRREPRQGRRGEGETKNGVAWFVGQVMKATGGKANPGAVNALLKTRLGLPEEG